MIPHHARTALIGFFLILAAPPPLPGAAVAAQPAGSRPAVAARSPPADGRIAPPTPTPPPAESETPPAGEPELAFLRDEANQPAAESPGLAGLLMRTLGALLLIVGMVVAAAWLMRRLGAARSSLSREDVPELSVLTTVALGDRRSLAVVRFGAQIFLLGSTAQAITVLAAETPERVLYAAPPRSVADMLEGIDVNPFDYELAYARRALKQNPEPGSEQDPRSGAWHEDGGEL